MIKHADATIDIKLAKDKEGVNIMIEEIGLNNVRGHVEKIVISSSAHWFMRSLNY